MKRENIAITPATPEDIGDMQDLFHKMFEIFHVDQNIEYPYTEDGRRYLESCIDNQIALVAKDNELMVGFLTGGIEDTLPFKTYRLQGHLHNLFILQTYRRQGIGHFQPVGQDFFLPTRTSSKLVLHF